MIIENIGEFKKIDIKDKEVFLDYFEKFPQIFCDFNLFNLLSWSIVYDYYWAIYQGRLIIFNKSTGFIFKPIGEPFPLNEILYISDSFISSNYSGNFCFFDEEYIKNLKYQNENTLSNYFNLVESKDNANYIYLTEKLAILSGRKFHNKRNLISQFMRNYPQYNLYILNRSNSDCSKFKECAELAERWIKNKESKLNNKNNENNNFEKDENLKKELLEVELKVLKNSCNYFKDLDIGLLIMEIDSSIIAFSVFSRQNKDMATIHFEKFDINYIGIPQVINNLTAKHLLGKYQYINREDDLGIAELRFAKNSYYPDILLTPYLLIRKYK